MLKGKGVLAPGWQQFRFPGVGIVGVERVLSSKARELRVRRKRRAKHRVSSRSEWLRRRVKAWKGQ